MPWVQAVPQALTGGRFVPTVNNLNDKVRPVSLSCIIHEWTGLFVVTTFPTRCGLWCVSALQFSSASPGWLPSFRCCFLFCKTYYLDCITPVLLPEGLKLLCTAERSLPGYVSPFVMKLQSNAYFWEFPFARLFLQTNRWTFMAKVRNITEQSTQASFILIFTDTPLLFAHFDVHSGVWVCTGSAPLCHLFAPSTSNPMHFVAVDAEDEAAAFQPLAEFWRFGPQPWEPLGSQEGVSLATQPPWTDKQVSLLCPLWASACCCFLGPQFIICNMGTVMPSFRFSPVLPAHVPMLRATTTASCCTFTPTSQITPLTRSQINTQRYWDSLEGVETWAQPSVSPYWNTVDRGALHPASHPMCSLTADFLPRQLPPKPGSAHSLCSSPVNRDVYKNITSASFPKNKLVEMNEKLEMILFLSFSVDAWSQAWKSWNPSKKTGWTCCSCPACLKMD